MTGLAGPTAVRLPLSQSPNTRAAAGHRARVPARITPERPPCHDCHILAVIVTIVSKRVYPSSMISKDVLMSAVLPSMMDAEQYLSWLS